LARRATSNWGIVDATARKIMAYFAANAWRAMACNATTCISTGREFTFGRKTDG
jgi:hypothetical protein